MAELLPPPVVASAVYTEEYYRTACGGAERWHASGGTEIDGLYYGMLTRAGLQPGERLLDIGAGRGEAVALAVTHFGAASALGVEYSADAVALSTTTLASHDVAGRAVVVAGDARMLPVPTGSVDLVTMLDVVEHLAPAELDRALAEVRRVLRPGGRLFAHTFPTSTMYDRSYRFVRAALLKRKSWPADPRGPLEKAMHVNEQTFAGLGRSLQRAGFTRSQVEVGEWVYVDFLPGHRARRLWQAADRVPPLRRYTRCNLFATAVR